MGQLQPLHRVTLGRSREVRGPDGLEMGIAVTIMTVVMIMAVGFGARLVPMVQTLDAVALASGPAYNEVIHYAVHGRWPPAGDPAILGDHTRGGHVDHLALGADGVITAQLMLGAVPGARTTWRAAGAETIRGALSLRPVLLGSRDAPAITFLCSYARPAADPVAASGTNLTTLDPRVLPPFCR